MCDAVWAQTHIVKALRALLIWQFILLVQTMGGGGGEKPQTWKWMCYIVLFWFVYTEQVRLCGACQQNITKEGLQPSISLESGFKSGHFLNVYIEMCFNIWYFSVNIEH